MCTAFVVVVAKREGVALQSERRSRVCCASLVASHSRNTHRLHARTQPPTTHRHRRCSLETQDTAQRRAGFDAAAPSSPLRMDDPIDAQAHLGGGGAGNADDAASAAASAAAAGGAAANAAAAAASAEDASDDALLADDDLAPDAEAEAEAMGNEEDFGMMHGGNNGGGHSADKDGSAADSKRASKRGCLSSGAGSDARGASLAQVGIALPLLMHSLTAASIISQSNINELLRAALRDASTTTGAASAATAAAASKDKPSSGAHKHKGDAAPHSLLHGTWEEEPVRLPYHLEANNHASCSQCLQQTLLPSLAHAAQLQPTPLYSYDWSVKQQALQTFARARCARPADGLAAATASAASAEGGILSQLLLEFLGQGQPGTSAATTAASSTSAIVAPATATATATATAVCDPRFLAILHRGLGNVTPLSLNLSSGEEQFYSAISRLGLQALQAPQATSTSLLASAGISAGDLRETMLRYWLGRGGLQQCLDAASFLLRQSTSAGEPEPRLRPFLRQWTALMRASSRTVLRVSRMKHLTQVANSARTTKLVCSVPAMSRAAAAAASIAAKRNPPVPHCRRWDYEDDSGWSRYDERVCEILEAAYQAGLPSVDFRLEAPASAASPAGYRADLVKMTQKNLTTGRERALRCLLALQIKDKSGRVTQTVEINMPHDTLIRDLRAELANYLRHDDKLLRLTYGNRVLRRADYENATIRAGILPLGTEGLTVTRLQKGDLEDMCTFTLTEARPVKQPLFECATCDFGSADGCFMCAVCAMQCHKGHDTRRVSDEESGGSVGFCCCGAGVCSDVVACRSLEGLPDAAETYYSPHMTLSPCGSFLYVLSTEHGLMKLGTGTTAASVTGQLYAQNTQMCAHAGAQLVCVKDAKARSVLMMRSPVLGASVLLHIDADTLLFTDQRTMLPAVADGVTVTAASSGSAAEFPPVSCIRPRSDATSNSWQLEYQTKPASTAADDPEGAKADAATLDENGQSVAAWSAVPAALIDQAKLVLCSNWSYGTLIHPQGTYDPSLPSLLLEEEGMVLRLPIKLGVRRAKVRVKHSENIQPLFYLPQTQQLQVITLVPLQPAATSASSNVSSPPTRSSRRREHGLALDLYQLPADFTATATPYCRRCTVRLPDRAASPAAASLTQPQLPFSYACPRCDAAAFDGDEKKRESEPAPSKGSASSSSKETQLDSMYRKSSDVGPSLPPSLPASPTGIVPTPSYSTDMPAPLPAAAMQTGAASSSSASPAARTASAEETELEEKLYLLSLLGVSRARAVAALQFAGGDLDGASNALLAEMEAVQSPGPAGDDAELSGAEEELRQALAAEAEAGDDAAASASPAPAISPSPSPSASPIVPQFEGTAAATSAAGTALACTLPVGEKFYEHALAATALGGPTSVPALGSGPLLLQYLAASFAKRVHLETIVDSFNKDARLRAAMAAAAGSAPSSNQSRMCDGCGGCGEPVVVGDRSDASLVEAGKAASLARLFVCQDRSCGDQVVLCQWCRLMGHWNSRSHRAEHQMSAAPNAHTSEPAQTSIAAALSSSATSAPAASNPQRLTLGEYACYLDVRRGVLVVLRDGREGALLAGPPSSTHHESCVLFDVESGTCLTRKLSLETRGDCYAMDEQSHSVWAFSALSVRLERWECMEDGPDATAVPVPEAESKSDTVDAVETATTILRHLPCISSSLATICSGLQQLLQLVELVFAPGSEPLRQSEPLVSTLLFQVRSHLRNWNLRTSPLYGAVPLSAAQLASECPSFAPTVARLKQLLLHALGLHMPSESETDRRNVRSMLQRKERERESSSSAARSRKSTPQSHAAHRTLFPSSSPADTTDDSGASTPPMMDLDASAAAVMAPWPAAVQSEACGIFVEGFDLFYSSWKQRVAVLERLVDASTSASQPLDTDDDVGGAAARPPPAIPCAQLLLSALDERYRSAYMGLKPMSCPNASATPGAEATDDASLLSPTVQNLIHTWMEVIFEHELTTAAEQSTPHKPHVLAHVVLSYQLHLMQLLSLQNQPESTAAAGSNGALLRQVRSANTAFMKLATEVFQHAVELLQGVEKALQQNQPQQDKSVDPAVSATLDASLAERTLACVWRGTLGSLVQWCLLSLSELQIDQLALLSSVTHAQLIVQFLKQTMALLCALSALQTRALQVSRVEQDESLDSDRSTPNQTRIRLGNTRQKIAALRQSGQLLTLHSLGAIVAAPRSRTSSSGASSASKRSSKSSSAPPLPYMLSPAATEVFTDIFFEFVSARSGYAAVRAPSPSGSAHHRWNLGRASLLRADLASLYRKRGSHSTEAATTKANHAFTKYGMRSANTEMSPAAAAYELVSGGLNRLAAAAPAIFGEGDEACALSLPAFLQLMTDACVESPRRVLRDLRVLELRHHFLKTHHPALHMLGDCKVAFSHVLHRLFSMPVEATVGQSSMQMTASGLHYVPRSLSAAASSVPSFAQALRDRTIEELVNIPPGSKEMSESLRIASAAAQRQITLARTAAANPSGEEGEAAGRSIGQSVLMRLLASQDSWKASVGSRTKLIFMSQFVLAPLLAPPPQHLPMASPVANLTPMLRHELAAEDLASSLVGETSTVKHGAAKLGQGMTGEFSDAAASERLSTLFQSCMRELGAGIASNFLIYPSSDAAVLSPHASPSKSLLASLSLLSGDRTPPGLSGSTNGIPASAALFLCEKLFFCALIKHNGLTDECIAYARSLELYRLLASKQTKNVRLLHQQACPEWLRKAIRATARFVRQPIMELLRKHREAQHEEAARLKEAAAARAAAKKAGATSSTISDASGLKERKEDNESIRFTPPPSAPPTPSHGPSAPSTPAAHRKLNVTVDALDEDEKEEIESFPSVSLYQTLDRWISNCEFLLGSELRTLLLQPPVAAGASRPHSLQSSPQRGLRSPLLTPQGGPGALTSASRTMSEFAAKDAAEAAGGSELLFPHRQAAADDADEDSEDEEMYRKQAEQEDGSGGLLLRRVQSDLFASPMRAAASGSMAHISNLDLGATSSMPAASTPHQARRLSDSDLNVPIALGAAGPGESDRPGTANSDASALSSWTSTTVRAAAASPPVEGDEEDSSAAQRLFESDWLARLMTHDQRLSDSIGFSVRFLTSSMTNRIKLLQLINSAFQAGHTQQIVDDLLPLVWNARILKDIHSSNSLRSSNQGDALLFFYQHLSQTLGKINIEPESVQQTAAMASFSLAQGSTPTSGALSSSHRGHLRVLYSRIRTILRYFSLDASQTDSDIILGSGMLTVLPRFIARLDHAQGEHQHRLHTQLYHPFVTPLTFAPASLSSSAEDLRALKDAVSRSTSGNTNLVLASSAPPAALVSPPASSLWLWDDAVRLSSTSQRWSWHIFCYLSSFLLGQPLSRHTAQQRYVLASTVSRQLNAMVQEHIQRIQQAIVSGFTFTGDVDTDTPPITNNPTVRSTAGRVRATDMPELGVFPLQVGNPLRVGGQLLDELVFRTVDMLKLLERVAAGPASQQQQAHTQRSAQEHSVCSRKHILFFLRVLRTDYVGSDADDSTKPPSASTRPHVPVALPSIIQLAIIQLLKRELPYHAPLLQPSLTQPPSASPSAPSSALNSPARKAPPHPHSTLFMPSFSPPLSSPPPPFSAALLRTPSTLAEDAAFSDVDLARELLATVAAMQSQQCLLNLDLWQQHHEEERSAARGPQDYKESESKQHSPPPSIATPEKSSELAGDTRSSSSTGAAVLSPLSAKEQARQASFRRIATLVCPSCSYIEFPACAKHRTFLTRQLASGAAACPDESCSTVTAAGSQWARCLSCKKPRSSTTGSVIGLSWWLISAAEASYASTASKSNTTAIIPHNVFTCPVCCVAEFPGTRTGGLTLNMNGRLYDAPTRKYLDIEQYQFTHFSPACKGQMQFTPVKLAKEEAAYLGRFIQRTPPIDPKLPLSDFGPGKGSTFPKATASAGSGANVSPSDSLAGHPSSASMLASLLGEPQAYMHWTPTEQGRACALMEMVNLLRSFLGTAPRDTTVPRDPTASKERESEPASSFTMRAVSSVDMQSLAPSTSLKTQWRESLLPMLRASFYDSASAVADLTATTASGSASSFAASAPRVLRSLLALLVLGGLPEILTNGSKVQVTVDDSVLTGIVQHYDPLLATVSVAVKRHAADSNSSETSKDAASTDGDAAGPRTGQDVASIIRQLGLQSDQQAFSAGVLEFRVDQVTPISPSPPPSLSVLGSVADVLQQAQQLLSIDPTPPQTRPLTPDDDERKEMVQSTPLASPAAIAMRQGMLGLLMAQLQQQLLLLLHLHLPSWLHSASPLSNDVLQLLSASLSRWQSSAMASSIPLHSHEWATTARVLSQQLVEQVGRLQDPLIDRRVPLGQSEMPRVEPIVATSTLSRASSTHAATSAASSAEIASHISSPRQLMFPSLQTGQSVRVTTGGSHLPLARSNAFSLLDRQESSDDESLESPSAVSVPVLAAPPPVPMMLQNLDRLSSMGFPPVACRFALASTRGNLEASISLILEQLGQAEEMEVDEAQANVAFEATIDRLGQRAAVEAHRAYQEAQMAQQAARQASAVVDASAPVAPPMTMPASSSYPGSGAASAMARPIAGAKSVSEAERRLVQAAPHIHMTSRYAWSEEVPLDALALAAPVDSAVAASRALNTGTAARPIDWSIEQDKAHLLARARLGTLLGAELVIPPDAVESLSRSASGAGPRKGYKVGDTLTIIDLVNKVCPAVVDDVNEDGSKIYLHYLGWSKKWDEWVSVDSKRIQPKFSVGEKLTVKDTCQKDSEAQVLEVAIKDNQLKIFIHYIAWSDKWREWIPATSNRIVARHKDRNEGAANSFAALQAALGLSSAGLASTPFALDNRTGEVLAVDWSTATASAAGGASASSSAAAEADPGPSVLLRVVDETQLHCTILIWVRLALLRSSTPRAHQTPTHLCPLPPKPSGFNAASIAALRLDTQGLLQMTVDAQQNACACLAKRIVQESLMRITHAPKTTVAAAEPAATLPVQALSPISPLSPVLLHSPADVQPALLRVLHQFKLPHLLPLFAHQSPSQQLSILNFAQPDLGASAAAVDSPAEKKDHRARTVATIAQLILARWQLDAMDAEAEHPAGGDDEVHEHAQLSFSSFEAEVLELIESAKESLLRSTQSMPMHKLTTVTQGQSITVAVEMHSRDQQRPAEDREDDEEATSDESSREDPVPFQLQLVSCVLPVFPASQLNPRFSKEAVWCIRFYADAAHTILLRELSINSDPHSRQIAPWVVTNPVFISSSLSTKSADKLAQAKDKPASKSGSSVSSAVTTALKTIAADDQATFSITPFQHEGMETMLLLTEAIAHVRRLQIAGVWATTQGVLPSQPSLSTTCQFDFSGASSSTASASFFLAVSRSVSLARQCDSFLVDLFDAFRDFLEQLHLVMPLVSNLRVRAMEAMTTILQTSMLASKASRDTRGVLLKPDAHRRSSEDTDDDSLHLSDSSSQRPGALDLSWVTTLILPEAKARYTAEKPNYPIFSVYLQRMLELLLVAMRYERSQAEYAAIDADRMDKPQEKPLLRALNADLPILLDLDELLLHATHPTAHAPIEDTGVDVEECSCVWCEELQDRRDESQQAAMLLDLAPSSVVGTIIADDDHFPMIRKADTEFFPRSKAAKNAQSLDSLSLVPEAGGRSQAAGSSISSILSSFNSRLFRRSPDTAAGDASTPTATSAAAPTVAAASSSSSSSAEVFSTSSTALVPFASDWRTQVSLCDRLLSSPSLRARLLNHLLNGTSAPSLSRPEIAFKRSVELDEMTSITASKHLYRSRPHVHALPPSGSAGAEKDKTGRKSALADADSLGRSGMFQQLVDAFIKANLHCRSIALRAEMGAVTFKCILSGVLDAGAAGLPGPFRQALAEISAALAEESMESSGTESAAMSLLIPSPNSRSQTGDDRNKLMLNPALLSRGEISLVQCRIFGQLMGIALRSKCCLNLDLASVIWKGLLELPLVEEDLASFDFTASRSLKFVDPSSDLPFTAEEFDEYLGYLTWTTVLSDGVTMVELKPGGAHTKVHFAQRALYAQKAIEARLQESSLLVSCIREGLLSVLPKQSLHFLSWRELELRVCGRPTVDLSVLEKHTVYSSGYTRQSPIIQHFWQVLRDFTQKELSAWLQFAWARGRLPADEAGGQGSYRMQLNILDAAAKNQAASPNNSDTPPAKDPNDMLLPTSETCFFNGQRPRHLQRFCCVRCALR